RLGALRTPPAGAPLADLPALPAVHDAHHPGSGPAELLPLPPRSDHLVVRPDIHMVVEPPGSGVSFELAGGSPIASPAGAWVAPATPWACAAPWASTSWT